MNLTGSTIGKAAVTFAALGAGVLTLSAPAWSAQSETQRGAQIAAEVQSGKLSASALSGEQYTRVGQYLMSRAFASTQTYEAMDNVMDRMMGTIGSDHMYRYLGERYYGKKVKLDGGSGSIYGWMGSMIRSYGGSGPYAGMMGRYLEQGAGSSSSGNGAYPMMGGGGVMGYAYANPSASRSSGWPTAAVATVAVLAAVLLAGGLVIARRRLRSRDGGPVTTAARHT
jgi:hypothetical protein